MADPADDFRAAVLQALGAAPDHIEPGAFMRFSTTGRKGDESAWCKLFDDRRAGIFGDFRAGSSVVWQQRGRAPLTSAERAAFRREIAQANAARRVAQGVSWELAAQRNARLWGACRTISDTQRRRDPAALYLRGRLALSAADALPLSGSLRLHRRLDYWEGGARVGSWPALVAQVQAFGGEPLALHRTWLTEDGRKAPVPGPVRKVTPASGDLAGACVRLAAWQPPTAGPHAGMVGIAEGIETALAAMLGSGVPTHAAYCAGNLAAWQWPPAARRLVIFADNDRTGREAADRLERRARAAGLAVQILAPKEEGRDWCDVWATRPAGQPAHDLVHDVAPTTERGQA